MRVERLSRALAGLSLVLTYYVATLTDEGFVPTLASAVSVMAALAAFLSSWRLRRHVTLPGTAWAGLFLFALAVATLVQGARPVDLRRAASFTALLLNLPVLMQVCAGAADRRALRAVLMGLLAVTLLQVAIQVSVWMPSLRSVYAEHPEAVMTSMGLDPRDKAASEDVAARISGLEPFGHLVTSNNLAIVLVMLAALARSMGQRLLGWAALLVSLLCFSKGVILAMLVAALISRRRLRSTTLVLLLCCASLLMWRKDVGQRLLSWSRAPALLSVEMRLSYWQTARTMATWGPVGIGGYGDFAAQARPDGGHYSNRAHNAFLELCAEVGFVAAFAAMIWLARLFRGLPSLVRETRPARPAVFWGATLGLGLVLVLTDPVFPLNGTNPFALGLTLVDRELVPSHPLLERGVKLLVLGLFVLVARGVLVRPWVVKPESLSYAATVFLIHLFIDTSLSHPGVMIVAFTLGALGWERGSAPSRLTWWLCPITALAVGVALHMGRFPHDPHSDPLVISAELAKLEDVPGTRGEAKILCLKWHDLEPAHPTPLRRLVSLTEGDERRNWLERLSATEPADPGLHLEVATLLFQMGESPDLVLDHLKRAREIDELPSLERYRLQEEERRMLRHLWERLAPAGTLP